MSSKPEIKKSPATPGSARQRQEIDLLTDEGLEEFVRAAYTQVEGKRDQRKAKLLEESLRISRDEVLKRRVPRETRCFPRLPTNASPPLPVEAMLYCRPCSDPSRDETASRGNSDMSELSAASDVISGMRKLEPVSVRILGSNGRQRTESLPHPIILEGAPDPVPRSSTTMFLKSQYHSEDEKNLMYVPYFGEDDDDDSVLDLFDTEHREKRLVFGAECKERDANDAIDEILSFIQRDLQENKIMEGWPTPAKGSQSPASSRSQLQTRIHSTLAEILGEEVDRINDRYRVLITTEQWPAGEQEIASSSGKVQDDGGTYLEVIDSYRRLFCRRCFTYDCNVHGNLDKPSLSLQTELALQKQLEGFWEDKSSALSVGTGFPKASSSADKKCAALSDSQLRQKRQMKESLDKFDEKHAAMSELSEANKVLCERMFTIFRGDIDKIAFTIGLPRKLVSDYCSSKELSFEELEDSIRPTTVPKRKSKKRCYSDPQSMRVYNQSWLRNVQGAEIHPFFNPCDHSGPCSEENCSCVQLSRFCTKHCVWGHKSRNFFRGCNCKGRCVNKTCSCVASKRECDPDLCRSCGACSDPPNQPATTQRCRNDNIGMRRHRHLLLAKSSVEDAGWGIYTKGALKRGDFVVEYVGELISQEEAERRGAIYDKVNRSYLFNLNSDMVVDSTRKGNKARFTNHSSKPNCETRILLVNGDNRIGLFAIQDIEPQSELFFDYRYDSTMDNDLILKAGMIVDWQKNPKMANTVKKMRV